MEFIERVYRIIARVQSQRGLPIPELTLAYDETLPGSGYRVENRCVYGGDRAGLMAGAGRYLREPAFCGTFVPQRKYIGTYFATHFGNYYMNAPLDELTEYLEDLALWGQNLLVVWYDMHDYTGIDDPKAAAYIERLRAILTAARGVGMMTGLTMLANEGYSTTPPELRADWHVQGRYFLNPRGHYHVEICPSREGGVELILRNRREMLERFADLQPDVCALWTYDQGGCTCDACQPWAANGFLRLAAPLRELIHRYNPDAEVTLCGWYLDHFIHGEWDAFLRELEADPKGFRYVAGIHNTDPTLPECVRIGQLPHGIRTIGFPEISMTGCFPWGGMGANPMPKRLEKGFLDNGQYQDGLWSYSEGVYEDMNKVIVLSLYAGAYKTAGEAVRAYCGFWFGDAHADALTELVYTLERAKQVWRGGSYEIAIDDAEALDALMTRVEDTLTRKTLRWQTLRLRVRLMKLLSENGGQIDDVVERELHTLEQLYHVDETSYFCVSPPTRKAISRNFGRT
ncbi:MAG: hypothetical protein GX929_08545 [Clostridiales bacterium]|jgi:hypothetical protein|nr:hypothetical protein [Clostridiales bacterium]